MARYIDADRLIAEYDRVHIGPAGGARKLMVEAPTADVVAIPCKIGDIVYAIRRYNGERTVKQGKVSQMFFTDDMELCIVVAHVARGLWGKTIFGSEEEAKEMVERLKK